MGTPAGATRVKGRCAYCRERPAIHLDHVVPQSLVKKTRKPIPERLLVTVPSCGECNWRKQTRRLVPLSMTALVVELNEHFPGPPWRVWTGGLSEPGYREVHR